MKVLARALAARAAAMELPASFQLLDLRQFRRARARAAAAAVLNRGSTGNRNLTCTAACRCSVSDWRRNGFIWHMLLS